MFTDDHKREFALRYLEYRRDAPKAASRLFPFDVAARMACLDLVYDPVVCEEIDALLKQFGFEHFLPSKFELAAKLYDTAETARDTDDKLKAYKLYADVMGYIDKPGTLIDARTQNVDNRSVIVVRDFGTADDWEAKAIAQQSRLIADANDSNDRRAAA